MKLNELSPNEGSSRPRKRVGRGLGSGKGKTAGRGHKGQKSRSGVALKGFEGGQMPIYMRLPKRGFTNPNRKTLTWINLGRITKAVSDGKIDATDITEDSLVASGVLRRKKDGVRLLAKGEVPQGASITVTGASQAAIAAVEKAGGSVTLLGKS